jgi:hypothetical protein
MHLSIILMAYKGPEVHLHGFLTSKLDAYKWSDSRPGRVNLEANLQYPLTGTLGGLRAGLDVMEKRRISCVCRESNHGPSSSHYTDRATLTPQWQ